MPDLTFTDAELDRLADLVAGRVEARLVDDSPWLNAEGAARYLACKLSRIRKLTMTGDLPVFRDGSRVLYRREDLDRFVRAGGALSP